MQIIQQACEKTGEKVVVLIDEYDKPLLRTLFNDDLHNVYREMLTGFYTVLKDADRYLRFVFITGVTKFSQLGIFSNLNQLIDIKYGSRLCNGLRYDKGRNRTRLPTRTGCPCRHEQADIRTNSKMN